MIAGFVHGLSTRDVQATLTEALGEGRLSQIKVIVSPPKWVCRPVRTISESVSQHRGVAFGVQVPRTGGSGRIRFRRGR